MSGSLHGVLAGSHYKRAWFTHSPFASFLIFDDFWWPLSQQFLEALRSSYLQLTLLQVILQLMKGFEKVMKNSANQQEKVTLAISSILVVIHGFEKYQIMAHTAIQENDLSILFHCWKKFLPMYFMMNKVHITPGTIQIALLSLLW